VRSPEKFNVHFCQKVPSIFACFQASAAPRPENSDSDEKDALFGLDTQINCTDSQYEGENVQYELTKKGKIINLQNRKKTNIT
jgi:hypothetical protein